MSAAPLADLLAESIAVVGIPRLLSPTTCECGNAYDRAGFDRLTPAQGAFYIYADISHLTNDSREFCSRMLREAGVATTPGIDFDRARGAGTLRISFAGSTAEMDEAVRRLKAWRRV